ncbi:MAG: HAD family hydrolase [Spirochaetota bacterium]|mgnify:FL=1
MKHPALFLFDIDGTIVRTNGAGMRSYKRAFRRIFFSDSAVIEETVDFAGKTDRVIFDHLAHRNNIVPTENDWLSFLAEYGSLLAAEAKDISRWEICHGAEDVIHMLSERSYIGLLTGNVGIGARIKLSAIGLYGYFPVGGLADDGYSREEIAEAALLKCRIHYHIDFSPEHVWVIGDTVHDVRCAKHIGARSIAVATGGSSVDELRRSSPDIAIEHLGMLAIDEFVPPPRAADNGGSCA